MVGSPTRIAAVLAVVAAAGAGIWLAQRRPPADPPPPPETPLHQPAAAPTPGPAPAPALAEPLPLPTPASAGIPEADCIAYPDGTKLPPLNGVKKAPQMVFNPRLMPFAKVVRKELDPRTGIEWYIHENGVRSTTRLQPDGKAYAEIDRAAAAQPVVPDK
jgi:hypothetical protein